jgi:hypothetical protein
MPPTHVGRNPRRGLFAVGAVAAALAAACSAACSDNSADQVTAPVSVGMTSQIAPYYDDGKTKIYQVQVPVQLPVRMPSDAELQGLGAAPAGTPYPRAPFLRAEDERVEIHYIISNIDDSDHNVWLLVDPWNEFVRWAPGAIVTEEGTNPNYGYDLYFKVPGKSRVQGTLTPDDAHEMAIKLAAEQNMLGSQQAQAAMQAQMTMMPSSFDTTGTANNIMNPFNRSNGNDPLYTPWIPPVIAGLTGFDVGLRTGEPANVAVEVLVDVQDLNGHRFVAQDTSDPQLGPPPATLSPPGARL